MSFLHTLQLLNRLHRLPIQPAESLPSEDEIGSVLQQKGIDFSWQRISLVFVLNFDST